LRDIQNRRSDDKFPSMLTSSWPRGIGSFTKQMWPVLLFN
jgi:hypothetical protein